MRRGIKYPSLVLPMAFNIRRLNKAKRDLDKVNREKELARQTLKIEGQISIGKKQISLMEATQKKLVQAEIKGMNEGLKKVLPALVESRQQAGQSHISGYLQSVKQRASKS